MVEVQPLDLARGEQPVLIDAAEQFEVALKQLVPDVVMCKPVMT